MWSDADPAFWSALTDASLHLQQPLWAALAAATIAALALLAILRGPQTLRVAGTQRRAGRRGRLLGVLERADVPWSLSVLLRGLAALALAAVLSGPVALLRDNPAEGDGVDLLIALDASGSMNALDAQIDGRRATRLELARHVVADFIGKRRGDRIGLVVFGEHAFTQAPLSVDHRLVLEALERVEVGLAGDATALGEAIGLATRRLVRGGSPEAQRVVLLLTDGRHNSGQLAPETAAAVAATRDVRIHAVGIGSTGIVPFAQQREGEPLRFEKVDLDRDTLGVIAARTGGRFFHARQPDDLRAVAVAIDALESRPLDPEPRYRHASLAAPLLALALLLLLLEAATAHGLLRRLP